MKSKLKKWIIIIASFLLVAIGALLGVSLLTNLSTTTINDIRLVDASTEKEIFDKEVYLTGSNANYFDVQIDAHSSSIVEYKVYSTNLAVASVNTIKGGYRINYHKTGSTKIVATTQESSEIKDSVTLNVREKVVTSFIVDDEKAINESEVSVFADNKEYRYSIKAFHGDSEQDINLSSILVLDNYNKDVFEYINIDDNSSELVIKADQNASTFREYVNLQSVRLSNDGEVETVNTFVVCINIKGNYISDIQLMLSSEPNFNKSKNITKT